LYKLETLEGTLLKGDFSTRRLCAFTPREGTKLARDQDTYEERLQRKETEQETERSEDGAEEETMAQEEAEEANEAEDTDDET
jgi:hypothetical protein